ncbi:MAG TPA: chemotaxis protein CheW [Bdellovibrionales bacterium]|nr:chemotaxis protein CheW [Bdellovibrionales bacterium]
MSQKITELITTFHIGSDIFGIEVGSVQEVAKQSQIVPVPLAPKFVRGLVNLRGQIATAVGLREMFNHNSADKKGEEMSVICKIDGNLVSLIVDSIGDVVEMEQANFETPPHTLPPDVRKYIKGIYKADGSFLSVLDLSRISRELSPTIETSSRINS